MRTLNEKPLLLCQSLNKSYIEGTIESPVLHQVSLAVMPHELVAIVGSSGSGKSTLLHILGMLDTADSGKVLFKNRSIFDLTANQQAELRNQQIGFIYQFHHLLGDFTALENVAMPLLIAGESMSHAKEKATQLLMQVGIAHRLSHRPSELSGGERQRVAIARALVNNPSLVLADEPTGNLDYQTAKGIYQLMRELNETMGTAFLVVTHDRELASHLDRQLFMADGVLKEGALTINTENQTPETGPSL